MMNKIKAFEVATWPCSEEYVKDQSIIWPAFDLLTGPEGPSGLSEIFYGVEVGKPNARAVLNWDSTEAHGKFTADQDALLKFVKMFEPSAKDGIPNGTIIHVALEEDVALASLRAPFIELRKISPKESTTTQAIHDALDKYVARMNESSSGVVGATYGHVIEEPEKLIVVVGREGGSEVEGELDIGEIAEEEISVVSLREYNNNENRLEPGRGTGMMICDNMPGPAVPAPRA